MSQDEGDYEVIDCHVHAPAGPRGTGSNFGWFLDFGADEFIRRLKAAGVSRACGTSGCLTAGPEGRRLMTESNDAAYKLRDQYPDFYIPAVQTHPDFPQESCAEIDRAVGKEGVRWVGEIAWYGFGRQEKLLSGDALQIFEHVQSLGVVLNIHCNDIEGIRFLCEKFTELQIVLAHPREQRENIERRVGLVREYPNLYLDLSGTGLHRYGMLWYAIEQAGPEKFLWGSDFPVCGAAGFLADVMHEPITDEDRQLVLSGNFKRLTGIA